MVLKTEKPTASNAKKCRKKIQSKKHALDTTTKRSSMGDTRIVSVKWSGRSGFSKLKTELEEWKWK